MNMAILMVIFAALCLIILFFSGRVILPYYRSADKTNRILLRLFVGGISAMLGIGFITGAGVVPFNKEAVLGIVSALGWFAMAALLILIARELWSVLRRIQLIRAVNTMAEPEPEQ